MLATVNVRVARGPFQVDTDVNLVLQSILQSFLA